MSKKKFDDSVYVHPTAVYTGNVSVGKGSSLWPHSAMRADLNYITVGENTSIQDCCVLHVGPDNPVKVGNYVLVTHGAVLHGCTVEDDCMIGSNAVVLDGAVLGKGTVVGAGVVVKPGLQVPAGSFVTGVPCVVKPGRPGQAEANHAVAVMYSVLAKTYLAGEETIGADELNAKIEMENKK